ncbi:hypothetical protein [Emticicia sp.]|uniref:hypothetical protein n=1 Tax=Emticicia sp. TaxID=1930953 RepID=UPI0037505E7F
MKNLLLVAVLAVFSCISSENAQAQAFEKGQKNFSVGVGFGYGLGVNASVDVGISDLLSVGAIGAFSSRNYGYLVSSNYRVTYIGVGGRVAAHVGKYLKDLGIDDNKIDPYVGLMGGFRAVKYNDSYSSNYNGTSAGLMLGGFVGARYYFKEKVGIYAEGGFPYSTVGITFKF